MIDDYIVAPEEKVDQTINNICTKSQLEAFHRMLFTDLYRREKPLDFTQNVSYEHKKYYVVPLRLTRSEGSKLEYQVDRKMLQKVENLYTKGYE